MATLRRIERLPRNFDEFVAEVASGLGELYGPAAAAAYKAKAFGNLQSALGHPDVDGLAMMDGNRAAGLLMSVLRGEVAQISFLHVLHDSAGQGIEDRLIRESVRTLWAGGVAAVLSESTTFGPLDDAKTYEALGFTRVDRAIMGAELGAPTLVTKSAPQTRPFRPEESRAVAEVLVKAYADSPDRRLHPEIRTENAALAFVSSYLAGGYGERTGEYGRVLGIEGQVKGAILGCLVAPGVGFVLQVAVDPGSRGQGFGQSLIVDLAKRFAADKLERLALGVTLSNPARHLYERLGLSVWREVPAHLWWRP